MQMSCPILLLPLHFLLLLLFLPLALTLPSMLSVVVFGGAGGNLLLNQRHRLNGQTATDSDPVMAEGDWMRAKAARAEALCGETGGGDVGGESSTGGDGNAGAPVHQTVTRHNTTVGAVGGTNLLLASDNECASDLSHGNGLFTTLFGRKRRGPVGGGALAPKEMTEPCTGAVDSRARRTSGAVGNEVEERMAGLDAQEALLHGDVELQPGGGTAALVSVVEVPAAVAATTDGRGGRGLARRIVRGVVCVTSDVWKRMGMRRWRRCRDAAGSVKVT